MSLCEATRKKKRDIVEFTWQNFMTVNKGKHTSISGKANNSWYQEKQEKKV